jgi:hypothetical protein
VSYDETDMGRPHSWIIDDPYGDYHGRYADARGCGIALPDMDFRTILKPQESTRKWCHFVRPKKERMT